MNQKIYKGDKVVIRVPIVTKTIRETNNEGITRVIERGKVTIKDITLLVTEGDESISTRSGARNYVLCKPLSNEDLHTLMISMTPSNRNNVRGSRSSLLTEQIKSFVIGISNYGELRELYKDKISEIIRSPENIGKDEPLL